MTRATASTPTAAPPASWSSSSRCSGGLVLELGCGSGALTRHLLAAGFRVIATDASPDMLELARAALGPDADLRRLTLPEDPLPAADAIVSVGHVISYLPDAAAVDRALVGHGRRAAARRGARASTSCDLAYGQIIRAGGRARPDRGGLGHHHPVRRPAPDKFVRDATTFVADGHGALAPRR